tara:strand:- start:88 stop:642 length:555 start_codon:yes stop_codon:yes gene_type:complete
MTHKDYERYRKQCEEAGRVDFYEHLISEGNNPGFAAMLAMQRPAGAKGTERAFLEGQQHWADSLSYNCAEALHRIAKESGISTQGKKYIGGIGRPNDPMAWVSTQDDVRTALKAKGLSATGGVNYKAPEREFKKRKRMADDLVHEYTAKELKKDPSLAEAVRKNPEKLKEVKEKVINKHTKGKK